MAKLTREEVKAILRKALALPGITGMKTSISLAQGWLELEEENAQLRAALPNLAKLGLLADWLDMKYPNDARPEVQQDLRTWAAKALALLEEKKS